MPSCVSWWAALEIVHSSSDPPYRVYCPPLWHKPLLMAHCIRVWYHRSVDDMTQCLLVSYSEAMPSYVSWWAALEIVHSSSDPPYRVYSPPLWHEPLLMAHCIRVWYHRSVDDMTQCLLVSYSEAMLSFSGRSWAIEILILLVAAHLSSHRTLLNKNLDHCDNQSATAWHPPLIRVSFVPLELTRDWYRHSLTLLN